MDRPKKGAKPERARPRSRPGERRSCCPLACMLDFLGDRWTLLLIRDLMLGRSRFKEFTSSPEGIPTNVLSNRLARLTEHGVVEKRPISEGNRRVTYHLTEKGEALRPVLLAMRDWGLQWEEGTEARLEKSSEVS